MCACCTDLWQLLISSYMVKYCVLESLWISATTFGFFYLNLRFFDIAGFESGRAKEDLVCKFWVVIRCWHGYLSAASKFGWLYVKNDIRLSEKSYLKWTQLCFEGNVRFCLPLTATYMLLFTHAAVCLADLTQKSTVFTSS